MALYSSYGPANGASFPSLYPGFTTGAYPSAGRQADGTPLWLAFGISYDGSAQVGKYTPSFGQALFPFAGEEFGSGTGSFSVLVSPDLQWSLPGLAEIPLGAIVLGIDVDGEPLFGVLALNFQGGTHPGKTKSSFKGQASIGWRGKNYFIGPDSYQILVGGV
jgi:hypothetical protein